MSGDDFARWLGAVRCTGPFTVADAAELFALIKSHVPDSVVDVYEAHGVVRVTVQTPRGTLNREIAVE